MLFSFFLLNLELYENAKWSCTCSLFYFLPTLPFNLSFIFREIWISFSWNIKVFTGEEKKKSYEIIQNWKLIFPKPAKPLNRWAGMWLQTWWTATRGGQFFLGQSHDPPSNVIITRLWTFEGIQVLWEFSSISISIELLLSIWTLGGAACSAGQSSQLCRIKDGRMEGGAENERGNWARCDVAQRNMAGYDVWRLGGKIRGQNSIKPYE